MKAAGIVIILILAVAFGAMAQEDLTSPILSSNAEPRNDLPQHQENDTNQSYLKTGIIYMIIASILGLIWIYFHYRF